MWEIGRAEILRAAARALEGAEPVLAAWLGGSDASGRTDEYSDVDLQAIVADEGVEDVFALVRAALEELGPLAARCRMPGRPATPYEQEFFQLEGADPHHALDFAVFPESTPREQRMLERERHGDVRVLFDRGEHLEPPPLDREAHRARLEQCLAHLRASYELFQPLVERAVRRGHAAEAAAFYQALTLRPLVELLRMRHAPERFDFGFRYLDRDLPGADRALVERLLYPRDGAALLENQAEARARVRLELAARAAGEWS